MPFLERVAPDVLDGIREGVKKGRFEIILDTWSFSLASMHTENEFDLQHSLAVTRLRDVFERTPEGYFPQEGAYHPSPYLLSKNAVKFLLLSYFQTREFERRIAGTLGFTLLRATSPLKCLL
nr:hypothetical protein [Candidatus Bathyarchaeota archaeon]